MRRRTGELSDMDYGFSPAPITEFANVSFRIKANLDRASQAYYPNF
jgi:hypothetical protein